MECFDLELKQFKGIVSANFDKSKVAPLTLVKGCAFDTEEHSRHIYDLENSTSIKLAPHICIYIYMTNCVNLIT